MTPEEQNKSIAEFCGWKWRPHWNVCHPNKKYWWYHPDLHGESCQYGFPDKTIPDYTDDLNAMNEAEKVIFTNGTGDWSDYIFKLGYCADMNYGQAWEFATASAAQRAEAFLKTIGKWEE